MQLRQFPHFLPEERWHHPRTLPVRISPEPALNSTSAASQGVTRGSSWWMVPWKSCAISTAMVRSCTGSSYYTFIIPRKFQNTQRIIDKLCGHISEISYRIHFRKRRDAIDSLSSILWGDPSKDCMAVLEHFFRISNTYAGTFRQFLSIPLFFWCDSRMQTTRFHLLCLGKRMLANLCIQGYNHSILQEGARHGRLSDHGTISEPGSDSH